MTAPADLEMIARWCGRVPELRRTGEMRWEAPVSGAVSYPEDGLSMVGEVEDRSYWFAHRNAAVLAMIERNPPPGPVFDIGGGNGFVSAGLIARGFPAVVIEPSPAGSAKALARNVPTIAAAFQDLTLPSKSIPAAGLFDVLEHIEDDRGALLRLHDALAPGGMLYLAVPTHAALWSQEDIEAGHFRRYTMGGLRRLLEETGFEPVFASYYFAAMILPILLLRALPYRLGLTGVRKTRSADDHMLPENAAGRALQAGLEGELKWLKNGRTVPAGASCLVGCRKAGQAAGSTRAHA